jgi:hypothetical protein
LFFAVGLEKYHQTTIRLVVALPPYTTISQQVSAQMTA